MPQRSTIKKMAAVNLGALAVASAADFSSDWFDVRELDAAAIMVLSGTVTSIGGGITFKLQHNDDTTDAGAEDVPAANLGDAESVTVADSDDDEIVWAQDYLGGKRYVRVVATGTGSPTADFTASGIGCYKSRTTTAFIAASVAAT